MKFLSGLCEDFLSLLFPRLCCGCGAHLVRNEKILCTDCYIGIPRTMYHLSRGNPLEQLFWGRCVIEKAAAFSFYTKGSRIRRIVHDIKYNGNRDAGIELGRIYASGLRDSVFLDDIDLLIPVPLHPVRQKKRGFNQSQLIAEGIAEITGIPVDINSLVRDTFSDTQTRKSRFERWLNVEGVFMVRDCNAVNGLHVLLVDDVITTGSTIEACTNALTSAGNTKVSAVALAVAVQ